MRCTAWAPRHAARAVGPADAGKPGARRSGINKPVAVLDWLEKARPAEEYILILDADMIMRRPFDPVRLGVRPGAPPTGGPCDGPGCAALPGRAARAGLRARPPCMAAPGRGPEPCSWHQPQRVLRARPLLRHLEPAVDVRRSADCAVGWIRDAGGARFGHAYHGGAARQAGRCRASMATSKASATSSRCGTSRTSRRAGTRWRGPWGAGATRRAQNPRWRAALAAASIYHVLGVGKLVCCARAVCCAGAGRTAGSRVRGARRAWRRWAALP